MQKFSIPERLPGLNELIAENRKSKYAGAELKKYADTLVSIYARSLKPMDKPCVIRITFTEPNHKRDIDNIYSGAKFVLDGLRYAGILQDDSQRWVTDLKCSVAFADKPKVEVVLDDTHIL